MTVVVAGSNEAGLPSVTTYRSPFRVSLAAVEVRPSPVDRKHTIMPSGSGRSSTLDGNWREPDRLPTLVPSPDNDALELTYANQPVHLRLFAERSHCEAWWSAAHNEGQPSCRHEIAGYELWGACSP